jgi:hypothetical protein
VATPTGAVRSVVEKKFALVSVVWSMPLAVPHCTASVWDAILSVASPVDIVRHRVLPLADRLLFVSPLTRVKSLWAAGVRVWELSVTLAILAVGTPPLAVGATLLSVPLAIVAVPSWILTVR